MPGCNNNKLFTAGTWNAEICEAMTPQDGDLATEAPKLTKDEGALDLGGPGDDGRSAARRAADKVRAFTPWPGTHVPVRVGDRPDVERLKILAARVAPECPAGGALAKVGKAVLLPCADGSALELLKVQPANRKPMDAAAYWNGLRGDACTPAA